MIHLTDGMILYHGSYTEVSEIDLSKCRAGLDFGQGFYLTSSFEPERLQDQFCFKTPEAVSSLVFERSIKYGDCNISF